MRNYESRKTRIPDAFGSSLESTVSRIKLRTSKYEEAIEELENVASSDESEDGRRPVDMAIAYSAAIERVREDERIDDESRQRRETRYVSRALKGIESARSRGLLAHDEIIELFDEKSLAALSSIRRVRKYLTALRSQVAPGKDTELGERTSEGPDRAEEKQR